LSFRLAGRHFILWPGMERAHVNQDGLLVRAGHKSPTGASILEFDRIGLNSIHSTGRFIRGSHGSAVWVSVLDQVLCAVMLCRKELRARATVFHPASTSC